MSKVKLRYNGDRPGQPGSCIVNGHKVTRGAEIEVESSEAEQLVGAGFEIVAPKAVNRKKTKEE